MKRSLATALTLVLGASCQVLAGITDYDEGASSGTGGSGTGASSNVGGDGGGGQDVGVGGGGRDTAFLGVFMDPTTVEGGAATRVAHDGQLRAVMGQQPPGSIAFGGADSLSDSAVGWVAVYRSAERVPTVAAFTATMENSSLSLGGVSIMSSNQDVFVAGTYSGSFAIAGDDAALGALGGTRMFVAKFRLPDGDGTELVLSDVEIADEAFMGNVAAVATLDGNVFVVGNTSDEFDFATPSPCGLLNVGLGVKGFVARLNADLDCNDMTWLRQGMSGNIDVRDAVYDEGLYVVGSFNGTLIWDGLQSPITATAPSGFVVRYDATASPTAAAPVTGPDATEVLVTDVDAAGDILALAGNYRGELDGKPTGGLGGFVKFWTKGTVDPAGETEEVVIPADMGSEHQSVYVALNAGAQSTGALIAMGCQGDFEVGLSLLAAQDASHDLCLALVGRGSSDMWGLVHADRFGDDAFEEAHGVIFPQSLHAMVIGRHAGALEIEPNALSSEGDGQRAFIASIQIDNNDP